MIEEYLEQLQKVLLQPRTIEEPIAEECSLLQAGKLTSQDVKQALRNPSIQLYLQYPLGAPPQMVTHKLRATYNHPVNQYVLWLSMQIARHCTTLVQRRIKRILRPIAHVSPTPASDAALLVLMGDPNYAALHRIGSKLLRFAQGKASIQESQSHN